MTADTLFTYSAEALSFDFVGRGAPAPLPAPPEPEALERMAGRVLAALGRSGLPHLTLLGLGSGALVSKLVGALPPGTLTVVEPDPALARALRAAGPSGGHLDWWAVDGPASLIADSSPWAALALLDRAGRGPGRALALANPELPPEAKRSLKVVEALLSRSRPLDMPLAESSAAPRPRLSVAAILAPTEPELPEFFAQLPPWIDELALVWDAEALPEALSDVAVPSGFPVRQLARPLDHDFSAQRCAMLDLCGGDWVLYLDADERLAPEAWAALPGLCALADGAGISGWRLPRVSPYPTAERALIGFGLWPDVQLRLFRNQPGGPELRFENPVHERLVGLEGGQGLALGLEIEHLSRLRKDRQEQARKLAGFDRAGGGSVRHALSEEYPSVPREVVSGPAGGPVRPLLLPPELS